MVNPVSYSEPESRRYSRAASIPYHLGGYSERRYSVVASHETRTATMAERDADNDSGTPPRKRIAVAVGLGFFLLPSLLPSSTLPF
jgi:hypothetical protein